MRGKLDWRKSAFGPGGKTTRIDAEPREFGGRCHKGQTRVSIRYFATPNTNTIKGGWAPRLRINGRTDRGGWHHRGLEREEAVAEAKQMALEEGERHSGDYCVIIQKGRPTK